MSRAATSALDRSVPSVTSWLCVAVGVGTALVALAVNEDRAELQDDHLRWVWPAAVLVGALSGWAMPRLRAMVGFPGVAPMAVLSALVATYLCVPETDQFPAAAVLPVGLLLIEVVLGRQVHLVLYAVAAAPIAWAGMFGANGRPSAFVGALFAWWAIAMAPLVAVVQRMATDVIATVVAGIGSVAAIVAARTGGIAETGRGSVLAVGVVALVSGAAGLAVAHFGPAGQEPAVSATPPHPSR